MAQAPMHSPSSPGLYSGFARAVAAPPAKPAASSQPLPTEDWYVGIGGVPLGPVRLSVLREKATAGQVNGESLVWREGFDEWQPVSSFPALLGYLEEAKQLRTSRTSLPAVVPPGRSSIATPTPSAAASSPTFGEPPRAAALSPSAAAALRPATPEPAPSLPFDLLRSSSLPASPRNGAHAATADSILGHAPEGRPSGELGPVSVPGASHGAPYGAPSTAPAANGATPHAMGAAVGGYGLTTTAGVATQQPIAIPSGPTSEIAPRSMPGRRRGLHPMAWAFIAMAAAFGGVAAWALFLRDKGSSVAALPTAAPNATGAPAGGPAPPPPPSAGGAPDNPDNPSDPQAGQNPSPGPGGGPRAVGVGTGRPGEPAPPIDTGSFGNTVPGPNSTAPAPSGGGQLTEGEINGVVARSKPGITRRCWMPAYYARSQSAPPNAKVNVSLTVGPSGSVQSVSASGAEAHYPGLASCVAGSVKAWQFPPSDEGAKISIPFSFSGQ
jgi:hypothetical protein